MCTAKALTSTGIASYLTTARVECHSAKTDNVLKENDVCAVQEKVTETLSLR